MNIPIAKPLDERYKLAIVEINDSLKDIVKCIRAKALLEKGFISTEEYRDMVLGKEIKKYEK